LRICLLSYRSHPHCGGQGVYVKHLSRALTDLGHRVTVLSGPPDPELDANVRLIRRWGLDLYNPVDPFRVPRLAELAQPLNLLEWLSVSLMGFPEPFLFGQRAYVWLRSRLADFDVVHDNQGLSYGIWAIGRRLPLAATIHHPITIDRDIAQRAASSLSVKLKIRRWHSFLTMQGMVARTLRRIITVSRSAREDIAAAFRIPLERFRIIPNGIDLNRFHPIPQIPRERKRIITTTSADVPLKGLRHLLSAVARLADPQVRLVVVGTARKNGRLNQLIETLGIRGQVRFTGPISQQAFVEEYARATLAVVPSIYEGFGLPAGEAMACGVPVVSTTGGALPEVVGDAGLLVPPGDAPTLAAAIGELFQNPRKAAHLGALGRQRVSTNFTWTEAAVRTVAVYREVLGADH
jgi:glycosyltransferase involved in cell wall biosynthesis